jgi:hypothetical protein
VVWTRYREFGSKIVSNSASQIAGAPRAALTTASERDGGTLSQLAGTLSPEDAAYLGAVGSCRRHPNIKAGQEGAVMNTTDAAGLRSLRETFDWAAAMTASAQALADALGKGIAQDDDGGELVG